MTKISAKVVADSLSAVGGHRLTTLLVTIPRYILAELNTHRMFSRNSASSRAKPFRIMVEEVDKEPFVPLAWQKDHKGMQGTEYFEHKAAIDPLIQNWLDAKDYAVSMARHLNEQMGLTKQLVNRLLEPYMWHTVLISATEWENFFHQRCPEYEVFIEGYAIQTFRSRKDLLNAVHESEIPKYEAYSNLDWLKLNKGAADIHMMFAAEAIWDAINESKPIQLRPGAWHLPFIDRYWNMDAFRDPNLVKDEAMANLARRVNEVMGELEGYDALEMMKRVSVSKCAATSYTIVGDDGVEEDEVKSLRRYDKLLAGYIKHMSPFEHVARAMTEEEEKNSAHTCFIEGMGADLQIGWSGNFRGFIQYRKMIPNENVVKEHDTN